MPVSMPHRIAFIVTEDWFFASHFLPMAEAAKACADDVCVVCRVRDHKALIERHGVRVVPFEADRSSRNPMKVLRDIARLRDILRREQPHLVHAVALRSIIVGGFALRPMTGQRIFALTGSGFLGAGKGLVAEAARAALRLALAMITTPTSVFLLENEDDVRLLPPSAIRDDQVRLVGGAGVDPVEVGDPPPSPPLRVAMVSRMLWSKGVDLAVDAVTRARAAGAPVELSLFGAPDAANPRALDEAQLRSWSEREGVRWHGRTDDVPSVWRSHHLCIAPSRGGEGLPRTILEAAAHGRAILTTDVPGCRRFVRDGVEGRVVRPSDAQALAEALTALAADPARLTAMGIAARQRLLEGFTSTAVRDTVAALYREALAR